MVNPDFLDLVQKNELSDDLKTDLINALGGKEITPEEEKARLRKAVHTLIAYMEKLHPEIGNEPDIIQLKEYFELYEGIKSTVKEAIYK